MDYVLWFTLVLCLVAFGALAAFVIYVWIPWLADRQFLFAEMEEGTAKAIMRNGRFHEFVMQFKDHRLDGNWNVVADLRVKGGILNYLGVVWIGPVSTVYEYTFSWAEFKQENASGKDGGHVILWPREAPTDFIFVKVFTYAFAAEDLKTKDNLPVRVRYSVTVRVVNPYKSLFAVDGWLQRIQLVANRVVRDIVGNYTYDQLRSETDGADMIAGQVRALTNAMPGEDAAKKPLPGTKEAYGVVIDSSDLQSIELQGDNAKKFEEATVMVYTAKQTKEATILDAEGKSRAKELLGKGEAVALKERIAVIVENPGIGKLLAQLDAMEAPAQGEKIIWANNPFLKDSGGLGDILDAFGVKSPAELAELIRNLRPQAA